MGVTFVFLLILTSLREFRPVRLMVNGLSGINESCRGDPKLFAPGASSNQWLYWYNAAHSPLVAMKRKIFSSGQKCVFDDPKLVSAGRKPGFGRSKPGFAGFEFGFPKSKPGV